MAFLAPLFFAALADLRRAGDHPPDAAREEADRRVSVADVPAAHSVSVGAAPPHPRLAAAGDAAGRHRADRAGVRAAVHEAADRGAGQLDGAARSGRAARPLLQHGVRRSMGSRARGGAAHRAGARPERPRHAHPVRHRRGAGSARHHRPHARAGGDRCARS